MCCKNIINSKVPHLEIGKEQNSIIVRSSLMELNINETISIMKDQWRCVGAVCSDSIVFFKVKSKWISTADPTSEVFNFDIKN